MNRKLKGSELDMVEKMIMEGVTPKRIVEALDFKVGDGTIGNIKKAMKERGVDVPEVERGPKPKKAPKVDAPYPSGLRPSEIRKAQIKRKAERTDDGKVDWNDVVARLEKEERDLQQRIDAGREAIKGIRKLFNIGTLDEGTAEPDLPDTLR